MGKTNIEWVDKSWNPIRARNKQTGEVGWFCTPACDACRFCYADAFNMRLGNRVPFKAQHADQVEIFIDDKMLRDPLRWKKPASIFPCSMTDLFGDFVTDFMIEQVWAVMAATQRHRYMVLTKRPDRMQAAATRIGKSIDILERHARSVGYTLKFEGMGMVPWPLSNVWLGTSIGDRKMLSRLEALRATPAALRFLSLEPLLEDLGEIDLTGIGLVIVGGESGKDARPMHPDWARSLRDQCQAAGVSFFMKQMTKKAPIPDDLMVREFPNAV